MAYLQKRCTRNLWCEVARRNEGNQKFPEPIITPTTKAEIGEHDADISKEEILAKGLATPEEYAILENTPWHSSTEELRSQQNVV